MADFLGQTIALADVWESYRFRDSPQAWPWHSQLQERGVCTLVWQEEVYLRVQPLPGDPEPGRRYCAGVGWGRGSEGMGATGSSYLGQGLPPQGSGADWEKKAPNQAPTRKNGRVGKALPYPPKQCFLPSCGMSTFLPWNPLPLPVVVGENTSWCEGSAGAPDLGTLSSGPHVLFLLPVSSSSW